MKTCKTFQPFLIHYMGNLVPLYDKAKPTEPTKSCWHSVNMYLFVKYLVCHSEGTRNSFFSSKATGWAFKKYLYYVWICYNILIFYNNSFQHTLLRVMRELENSCQFQEEDEEIYGATGNG